MFTQLQTYSIHLMIYLVMLFIRSWAVVGDYDNICQLSLQILWTGLCQENFTASPGPPLSTANAGATNAAGGVAPPSYALVLTKVSSTTSTTWLARFNAVQLSWQFFLVTNSELVKKERKSRVDMV